MNIEIKCKIKVPNIEEEVEMTPAQLNKFHDDLTKLINANYDALNNVNDDK